MSLLRLLACCLLLAAPAFAQAPQPAPAATQPAAASDLQRLIEVLRDDGRRAELLRALEAALRPPG
ncbi:hypothetical protein, partial [Falsiroseomonas oryzae]|uniref:hypothetical protein n=1 Tax=Falsiroseomonas oryzae TaxID=2766473 RepID=UPI0022EAB26C